MEGENQGEDGVCDWGIMNRCLFVVTRELETNRRNCSTLLQLPEPESLQEEHGCRITRVPPQHGRDFA